MKYITLIFFAQICISCNQNSNRDQAPATDPVNVGNFDWLLGSWVRTNDQEGNLTYEHWTRNSGTEYIGLGCTLQDGDTIFKEHLRLVKSDDIWNFEVTGINESPTSFLVIRQAEYRFACENMNNEFPTNIEYSFQDSVLYARISGGENEISFLFEKIPVK